MNKLSCRQKYAQANKFPVWMIFAIVTTISAFHILSNHTKSYAVEPDASAARIDGVSIDNTAYIGVRNGTNGQNRRAMGEVLRDPNTSLYVQRGNHNARLGLLRQNGSSNGFFVLAGPDLNTANLFRFPCILNGKHTVGYSPVGQRGTRNLSCLVRRPVQSLRQPRRGSQLLNPQTVYNNFLSHSLETAPLRSKSLVSKNAHVAEIRNPTSKSLDSKNTQIAQSEVCIGAICFDVKVKPRNPEPGKEGEAVIVSPSTDAAILYQTHYEDDQLVIDVVRGVVDVETPTGKTTVTEGNRYAYLFDSHRGGLIGSSNPDEEAINNFLDYTKWESLGSEIQELRKTLNWEVSPSSQSTVTLESVALEQSSTDAIGPLKGLITLSNPAPDDIVVNLSTSDSEAVEVPSTITIPAGATSASFVATTKNFSGGTRTVDITASYGGVTRTFTLTIVVPG